MFGTAAGAEGSCPSANTQGWREDAAHMAAAPGDAAHSPQSPASGRCCRAGLRTNPDLSYPCVAGGVEVPLPLGRQHIRGKGKRVQGFLLLQQEAR